MGSRIPQKKAPGEQPGVWSGAQAAGLGLSGEVSTDALEALLSGRDPVSGVTLGYPLQDRIEVTHPQDPDLPSVERVTVWSG